MLVFDLDMTVIDTSHRIRFLADGSQDIDDWVRKCTPEYIMQDRLLPLANYWKNQQSIGKKIAVITSRIMTAADYRYLDDNNLSYYFLLSRLENDRRPCHEYKRAQFRRLHIVTGIPYPYMRYFEDNEACLDMARKLGVNCFDAKVYNKLRIEKLA